MKKLLSAFAALCLFACQVDIPKMLVKGSIQIGKGDAEPFTVVVESSQPLVDNADASVPPPAADASRPDAAPMPVLDASYPDAAPRLDASAPDAAPRDASFAADASFNPDASVPRDASVAAADAGTLTPPTTTAWHRLGLGVNIIGAGYYESAWIYLNNMRHGNAPQSWGQLIQNRCCAPRVLKWEGTGTMDISGVTIIRRAANRIEYTNRAVQLPVPHTDEAWGMPLLRRTGDLRNIVDVEIEYEAALAANPDAIHPAFVTYLAPYKMIRTMDLTATNNSEVSTWAQRAQPNREQRFAGSMAWEDAISIANQTDRDLWLNLPALANDDYVTQFAQLFAAGLEPGREVIVEFSNETWNGGMFRQYHQSSAAATARGGFDPNEFTRVAQYVGTRTAEVAIIIKRILPRARIVLGGFVASQYFNEKAMERCGTACEAISIAPYFYRNLSSNDFAAMSASVDSELNLIRESKALADRFRTPLIGYESGFHGLGTAVTRDACLDPRMGDLYLRLYRGWASIGGGLIMHYAGPSKPAAFGIWGDVYLQNDLTTPKYRAIQQLATEWR